MNETYISARFILVNSLLVCVNKYEVVFDMEIKYQSINLKEFSNQDELTTSKLDVFLIWENVCLILRQKIDRKKVLT